MAISTILGVSGFIFNIYGEYKNKNLEKHKKAEADLLLAISEIFELSPEDFTNVLFIGMLPKYLAQVDYEMKKWKIRKLKIKETFYEFGKIIIRSGIDRIKDMGKAYEKWGKDTQEKIKNLAQLKELEKLDPEKFKVITNSIFSRIKSEMAQYFIWVLDFMRRTTIKELPEYHKKLQAILHRIQQMNKMQPLELYYYCKKMSGQS